MPQPTFPDPFPISLSLIHSFIHSFPDFSSSHLPHFRRTTAVRIRSPLNTLEACDSSSFQSRVSIPELFIRSGLLAVLIRDKNPMLTNRVPSVATKYGFSHPRGQIAACGRHRYHASDSFKTPTSTGGHPCKFPARHAGRPERKSGG